MVSFLYLCLTVTSWSQQSYLLQFQSFNYWCWKTPESPLQLIIVILVMWSRQDTRLGRLTWKTEYEHFISPLASVGWHTCRCRRQWKTTLFSVHSCTALLSHAIITTSFTVLDKRLCLSLQLCFMHTHMWSYQPIIDTTAVEATTEYTLNQKQQERLHTCQCYVITTIAIIIIIIIKVTVSQ